MSNNHDLQVDLSKLHSKIADINSRLQSEIADNNTTIQMKDASIKRKDSELEAKSRALEEKDATISTMSKQLNKTREYLTTKQQALQATITWKQCAKLPTDLSEANTTVINGKVCCGGGWTGDGNEYIVYCYDPPQDKWTTLRPLRIKQFGLGQVSDKLVAVGGWKNAPVKEVYTYDERSHMWKQTIPPMPTARWFPSVLSLQSALVVAGGDREISSYIASVEIFKPDTSQWYRTDPLPTACHNISLVAVGNACYALGGYKGSFLKQALYASVDDLLGNAVPANQTTHSGSSDTQSTWKTLPNTPTYRPAVAVLAGSLLAIGGKETSIGGASKKEVYMYSPSTSSWIYISDLPVPRSGTAVAVLSSTEILVIGGHCDGARVNNVYKGTLTLS